MSEISLQNTVGQLVVERPDRARVFEAFGLDYCCGGKRTILDACAEKGIDPSALLEALQVHDLTTPRSEELDWSRAGLGEIVDHILITHHEYLRRELPRIEAMAEKVALVHGERHPEMVEVYKLFERFKPEQELHMAKEEGVLFPMCKLLDTASRCHAHSALARCVILLRRWKESMPWLAMTLQRCVVSPTVLLHQRMLATPFVCC